MSKPPKRTSTAFSRSDTSATLRTKDRQAVVFVKLSDSGIVSLDTYREGGTLSCHQEFKPGVDYK